VPPKLLFCLLGFRVYGLATVLLVTFIHQRGIYNIKYPILMKQRYCAEVYGGTKMVLPYLLFMFVISPPLTAKC
jgi:hypothetical protein